MKQSLIMLSLLCGLFTIKAAAQGDQLIERGEYSLAFMDNSSMISEELGQKLISTFFEVYPKMVKAYNAKASKTGYSFN
ncbi:hypothetical protein [Pedobacter agri]|uniref:hypothetical protein n=1 Tax=Pedobacter agri TaxID=454586 RepID=UPI00277FE36C|nr:hypothetical protein [Pedobacter agri]MDQ1141718.1 hypothetical protein [Pedobacter agri]